MSGVSAFWTAYSAKRGDVHVEAIAIWVEGSGSTASLSFVVVDQNGHASIAKADELDLYGAYADEGGADE